MVPATSVRMRGQLKKMTDVIEIPSINNMATERTGYPDQKPLALLRLLVSVSTAGYDTPFADQKPVALLRLLVDACCPPAGTVLDPFCGSGTTLVAAIESGRSAIGCDVNPEAIEIASSLSCGGEDLR